MKKHLLIIVSLMIMTLMVRAQITITQTDFPNIGTSTNWIYDTLPAGSIVPGIAGSNLTWDFALLHSHTTSTYNYVTTSSTPFASSFAMANMSAIIPGTYYYYVNSSPSSVQMWGLGGNILGTGTQLALVYNNSETMMKFPSTYNSSFTDTSFYNRKFFYGQTVSGYYIDSVREKQTNYITSLFDAWGNLTTPDGTFPVIRQNLVKHTIDSTWVRVQAFSMWLAYSHKNDTTQSYAYYTNGANEALVNIIYYPDSNVIKEVDWIHATPVATDDYTLNNEIITFPNPVMDVLNINNSGNENVYAVIYDITGREIINILLNANNLVTLNVVDIENGMYIVKIYNKSGIIKSEKIMINH
jgi:hypothetical protein